MGQMTEREEGEGLPLRWRDGDEDDASRWMGMWYLQHSNWRRPGAPISWWGVKWW